jgi:hypothetical protein
MFLYSRARRGGTPSQQEDIYAVTIVQSFGDLIVVYLALLPLGGDVA